MMNELEEQKDMAMSMEETDYDEVDEDLNQDEMDEDTDEDDTSEDMTDEEDALDEHVLEEEMEEEEIDEGTGEPCALCPPTPTLKITPGQRRAYSSIHRPCSICAASHPKDDSLCDSCRHLRFGHLIRCLGAGTRKQRAFPFPPVSFNESAETTCPICRCVKNLVSLGLNAEERSRLTKANHEIWFSFEAPESTSFAASSTVLAKFQLICWDIFDIGHLHIDDLLSQYRGNQTTPTNTISALSPLEEFVSWPRLKEAITTCDETHTECLDENDPQLPRGFRVIDVLQRCIVERRESDFVALSYVWGANLQPTLHIALRSTIADFMKTGGLPASNMPQTIEDAMKVCVRLGYRYLWADRLCIVQDDMEDKKNQIRAMGGIYSSARIVLIVAYGDSMNFGIPGVSHARSTSQHSEEVLGLRITNIMREAENDALAVWPTRGWTYQEAVLSKRRLYLTSRRAFFECNRLTFHEDKFNMIKRDAYYDYTREFTFRNQLTLPKDRSRFGSFTRHLVGYTSRELTHQSDAYDALEGISISLYPGPNAFVYGLPLPDFDLSLLWYSNLGALPPKRVEVQGRILPTWSWSCLAGLSEQLMCERGVSFYGALVSWCLSDELKRTKAPVPLGRPLEVILDKDWQFYMALACQEGCVENVSVTFSCATDHWTSMRRQFRARWKDYPAFFAHALAPPPNMAELISTDNALSADTFKPGVLIARCQSAALKLAPSSLGGPTRSLLIISPDRRPIGRLVGETRLLKQERSSSENGSDAEYEFIALSLAGGEPDLDEDYGTEDYVDREGFSLPEPPVVNVLMVEREGGYVRRRELGFVYLIDWARLRREWTWVMLE